MFLICRPTFLDPSWFTLDTVETIIDGYEGLVHHRSVTLIKKTVELVEDKVVDSKVKPGAKSKQQPGLVEPQSIVFVSAVETAATSVVVGE